MAWKTPIMIIRTAAKSVSPTAAPLGAGLVFMGFLSE